MSDTKLRKLVYAALFGAVIFVLTAFLKVTFPWMTSDGYVHLGQAGVFLAALFLSPYYAAAAASIGSALADIFLGFPFWAPGTVVIKALMVWAVVAIADKSNIVKPRSILGLCVSGSVMALGYYVYEAVFLAHNFISPLPGLASLFVEAAVNIAVTIIVYPALKKAMPRIGI